MNQYSVQVIKSNRRTIGIEINADLEIKVRAPYRMSERQIAAFIKEKESWIEKHLEAMRKRKEKPEMLPEVSDSTVEEIKKLADEARLIIPERVEYYAKIMGVTYGKITIRNQKTRWGSCSESGNLNFNCLLMKTPPEVLDYVVVHELCHRKEMNHSKKFWSEVEKILPDYRAAKQWLKNNRVC